MRMRGESGCREGVGTGREGSGDGGELCSSKISSGSSISRSRGFPDAARAKSPRALAFSLTAPLPSPALREEDEGGGRESGARSSCFFSAFPRSIVESGGGGGVRGPKFAGELSARFASSGSAAAEFARSLHPPPLSPARNLR